MLDHIDFYIKLAEIIENYKLRRIGILGASEYLTKLNDEAKLSNLDLEVDHLILHETAEEVVEDEEYDDDDDEDMDYDDYGEEEYDEEDVDYDF